MRGTGRKWGFVNESVVSLKLIDGNGEVHECRPSDDLFKAAMGWVGAVGIISEVVLKGVDRYYAAAEALFKEMGTRPHLGKFCESFANADMARLHGHRFERFLDLVELRDPDRKFANSFTRRVFGQGEETYPRR